MVEKIVARAKEQHSRRIQRTWHKYYDKVIRRRKAEETRKRLLAEADAEVLLIAIGLWDACLCTVDFAFVV
jgi:CRISPR/Cas system-associated endonuclease Cas3-HD